MLRSSIHLALLALLLSPPTAPASSPGPRSPATPPTAPSTRPPPLLGQWIWTPADQRLFQNARARFPDLEPCPWVSTLSFAGQQVTQRLANPPASSAASSRTSIVIRFDDRFHAIWDARTPQQAAAEVGSKLEKLLALISVRGLKLHEIQLDYDAPIRRLEAWSILVRALSAGPLRGTRVWITSLPAHLEQPRYGDWFRDAAAGHILQLFDTGLAPSRAVAERLAAELHAQRFPFRIGLGAFERFGDHGPTRHRQWFDALSFFTSDPDYRGLWIFPGGRSWLSLVPVASPSP